MRTLGVILLVIGIFMTAFTGFNLVRQKKVVDLGNVEIRAKEKTPIYWSPVTGGVLVLAGVIVLLMSRKKISI